ncbi:ATP-binding protein [Candidatus Berkelbacteria bacterium]|nr:ATP-binding protein [Candidatus Berkelbacteria bacterium]
MSEKNKPAPTQKYLDIERIRDGVVILKDGRLRKIIRANPLNFDLKSTKEKEVATFQYQNFLNTLKFPIEIVIQSRRVDLSGYISKIKDSTANEVNELLQKQANDYLEFIQTLSNEINIMDKSFYVVIGHVARGAVEKSTLIDKILSRKKTGLSHMSDDEFSEYKEVLNERSRTISSRLNSLGISTKELETKEVIELFYNTYNPEESYTQHLDDPNRVTAPVIEQGKQLVADASALGEPPPPPPPSDATLNVKPPAPTDVVAPQAMKRTTIGEIFGKLGIKQGPASAEEVFRQGIASVLDIIAPGGINITPNYLQLGNFYVRGMFVYTYPRYLETNWLSPIINYDATLDVSQFIYPIETNVLLGQLRRKTTQLQSSLTIEAEKGLVRNPELETAIGDIEELRDTLQKGETRLFQFALYFNIYATTLDELNKLTKQFEAILGGQLIYTKQALLQMEQGFNSTLPLLNDQLDIVRNLDTASLSTTFPFTSAELSHHDGVLYGINLHNSSLVLFDRWKMENANQIVFAKSGAGKSYAVKLEILRTLMLGAEAIIIDPESEYKVMAQAVGGTFVDVSLNSQQKINPFDLPKFSTENGESGEQILRANVTSVHGLISLMAGGLSAEEDNLLDKALYETYALKDITTDPATHTNPAPVISDLVAVLQNMTGTQSLVNRLAKFTEGSFASLLNSPTNVDMGNKVTVFSIRDMEEELRPIAMYLVLNYVWARVKSELKQRLLVIDEGWLMMRYEDSAKFLNAIVKRARKYYLGVTVISQDVSDFLDSSYGRSVVNNSSTQLLLGQSTAAIDKIAETFKLTDGEKFFLTEAEVGQGLFFAGNNRAAVQIVASFTEDQVITTDPRQLLDLYGASGAPGQNQQANG